MGVLVDDHLLPAWIDQERPLHVGEVDVVSIAREAADVTQARTQGHRDATSGRGLLRRRSASPDL